MSKRLDVLNAVKAMVETALPGVTVLGLDNDGVAPEALPEGGRAVIRAGDPGDPAIDLSPVTYNYEHRIPIELARYAAPDGSQTAEQLLDADFGRLSAAIEADRTIGGAVDYLDAFAPETFDVFVSGSRVARGGEAALIATYATQQPL